MVSNYFRQNNDFYGIHKNDILNKVKNIVLEDKDYKFKYLNCNRAGFRTGLR